MHSGLSDDFGVSYATFNEKCPKRFWSDDFIPGFDRLEQLGVLSADGFPEFAIGGSNILVSAPNRDRKSAAWADKAP
jgi:hypothetical protein